jgi:general secretion pathway protein K
MNRQSERGVALVITLLMVALLVALILEFDASTRNELKAATNFRDGMKASYLAKAGVAAAQAIMEEDMKIDGMFGRKSDTLFEVWATPLPSYPIGDGVVSVSVTDEAGKLNLNDLAALTDREASDSLKLQDHIRRFEQLFELLYLDITLLDAILDWLDPDNRQRADGAEAQYYGALDRPYGIKNGPFDSLSELRLVKGMTEQAFKRLSLFVTVYPRSPKGITPVNVNTADPIVLQALGDQGNISEAIAGDIVQARPFWTNQDLHRVTALGNIDEKLRADKVIAVGSQYFSVRAVGTVRETSKIVKAIIERAGGEKSKLLYLRME